MVLRTSLSSRVPLYTMASNAPLDYASACRVVVARGYYRVARAKVRRRDEVLCRILATSLCILRSPRQARRAIAPVPRRIAKTCECRRNKRILREPRVLSRNSSSRIRKPASRVPCQGKSSCRRANGRRPELFNCKRKRSETCEARATGFVLGYFRGRAPVFPLRRADFVPRGFARGRVRRQHKHPDA